MISPVVAWVMVMWRSWIRSRTGWVGERACGATELVDGGPEGGQDDWAGDAGVGAEVQGHPGVVVEPGDDLDVGAGG